MGNESVEAYLCSAETHDLLRRGAQLVAQQSALGFISFRSSAQGDGAVKAQPKRCFSRGISSCKVMLEAYFERFAFKNEVNTE